MSDRGVRGLLFALLATSFLVRVLWLDYGGRQTILDEGYYISSVHHILGLAPLPGDPYPYAREGLDTVIEHPIGGKLIMAASVRIVGDNPYGWRLPSALFGTLAIFLVYVLAYRLTDSRLAGLAAATLVALDPMMLVHSRVAMLEIFVVVFLLAAWCAYAAGRPILAGAMIAAATCCKLTGLSGVLVVALYAMGKTWMDRARSGRWSFVQLRPLIVAIGTLVVMLPAALWLLNSRASIFPNPFDNLYYMYTYLAATFDFRPSGPIPQSRPWEWLLNRQAITYFHEGVLNLRGLYNPMLIVAVIPVTIWAAYDALKRRSDAALMVVAIIAGCFFPFVVASLQVPRQTYLYYFLPTLPAIAIGVVLMARAWRLPRAITIGYMLAAAAAFIYFFPFRGLP